MSGRLPFNADQIRKRAAKASADNSGVLSVSALASIVDRAIGEGVPKSVRVLGEISGFRERTHWYFDLKDANAVIQCVVFASSARKLGFVPENGQEVVASGRVDFYAKAGKVSLIATRLEPVGAGALDLAYQKLVNELRQLGWFEADRKAALPTFPRRIAVITSRSSAAYQDVLDTARRRCPAVGVLLVDARVQGDGAKAEVVRALDRLASAHESLGVDAIVLTRGGGSMEDLWTFNEREVAEAIVRCPIPIVAAIGHETDTTIAELVADVRAATPTQAAMRLVPDRQALGEQLARQRSRLTRSVRRGVDEAARALGSIDRRPTFQRPERLIAEPRDRLAQTHQRMIRSMRSRLSQNAARFERLAGRLERHKPAALATRFQSRRSARLASVSQRLRSAIEHRLDPRAIDHVLGRLDRAVHDRVQAHRTRLSARRRELEAVGPMAVLQRGYSVTLGPEGRVVRSLADVAPGDRIETRLADGSIESVVGGADPTRKPRRPKRKPPEGRDQMDLFNDKR